MGDMVTIDVILKDDPKAFEELKELRKEMAVNPELFNFPEEKVTQGSRKMKQLLEDFRRDNRFREGLDKIVLGQPKYEVSDLRRLYAMYMGYLSALDTFREEFLFSEPSYQIKKALCKKYGIDPQLFDHIRIAALTDRLDGWDFNEDTSGDICLIESEEDRNLPVDIHTFHLKVVDDIESVVYPVNIKLHRFASKRDVLDFIDKRWEDIKPYLDEKRTRERKIDRPIADLIWKHRNEKAKDIKVMLDEKFPKQGLVYFDITKIISEEKKRRGYKASKKENSAPH